MDAVYKTVSVVIATYNGSKFIREQINSILKQSLRPLEIIVSDDISSDNTLEVVRSCADCANTPIKIVVNESRLGFRDNFLTASMLAKGDFIAFCDQDDIWEPTKLEKAAEYFYDKRVSMIVHAAASFNDRTGKLSSFSQGIRSTVVKPPLSYDPWLTFLGFSMVFRRELLYLVDSQRRFNDFIVPDEKIAHDRWIMFLAQIVGETVEIGEQLVSYRQHSGNLFGDKGKKNNSKRREIIDQTNDYLFATRDMMRLAQEIPDNTLSYFPMFDRDRAVIFLEKAVSQLEHRKRVYDASRRTLALIMVFKKIYVMACINLLTAILFAGDR